MHAINQELSEYSPTLAQKPQIVVLNKMDLSDAEDTLELIRMELGDDCPEILPISAVSGQGVRDLLRLLARRLIEIPIPEPVLPVLRPHLEREDKRFEIVSEGEDVYRVRGQEIERLAIMTDWASDESMERFERILIARGVSLALEQAGVDLGDTVYIGEVELEWR